MNKIRAKKKTLSYCETKNYYFYLYRLEKGRYLINKV